MELASMLCKYCYWEESDRRGWVEKAKLTGWLNIQVKGWGQVFFCVLLRAFNNGAGKEAVLSQRKFTQTLT